MKQVKERVYVHAHALSDARESERKRATDRSIRDGKNMGIAEK